MSILEERRMDGTRSKLMKERPYVCSAAQMSTTRHICSRRRDQPVTFLSWRILGCRSRSLFAGQCPSGPEPWLPPVALGSEWEGELYCAAGWLTWQDTVLGVVVLRNIPGSLSWLLLSCMSAPPRAMRSCASHASLSQRVQTAAAADTTGMTGPRRPTKHFTVALWYRSLKAVRGRSRACLLSSLHFQEIGRRHATGHTRHLLPHVDRSTVGYLFCRLLYQYYLPIRHTCMQALWVRGLCSLLCHVCYRFGGITRRNMNGTHTSPD